MAHGFWGGEKYEWRSIVRKAIFSRENDLWHTRVANDNELVRFRQIHIFFLYHVFYGRFQATDFSSAYHDIFLICGQLFLIKTLMFVVFVAGLTVTLFATACRM